MSLAAGSWLKSPASGPKCHTIWVSGVGCQVSENREPQNIEYRMLNIEGKENFIIRNSLFDIRYSK